MYFYFLASLALLFSVAVAQECAIFTATLTQPSICNLGYNTTQSSPEAANNLYQFFSTLSILPSKKCFEEYTKYYCSVQYPLCNNDNTVQPACTAQCRAAVMACQEDNDIQIFSGTAFELPSCTGPAPACDVPTTNSDKFYTDDCQYYNISGYTTLSNENEIICRPLYKVYDLNTESYSNATLLVTSLRRVDGLASGDPDLNLYPCLKAFSSMFCSLSMLPCNPDGALPLLDMCASACNEVRTACANYVDNFKGSGLAIPDEATCNLFPTTNCFTINANDTNVGFYFGGDPPPAIQPTKAPGDEEPDDSNDIFPPSGPGVGGGVGAGVLVGLLLVIGLIMLVMKKQDSR